jgi:hypothetical protein
MTWHRILAGLLCLVGLGAAAEPAQAPRRPSPRDFLPAPLPARWKSLPLTEVTPYRTEGLRSQLVFGARSPEGSYAFVTMIDNGPDRPPVTASDLEELYTPDLYSDWKLTAFQNGRDVLVLGDRGLEVFWNAMEGSGSGHDFVSSTTTPTIARTVCLPTFFRKGERLFNWLLIFNFRGPRSASLDLQEFEAYWRRFSLPEQGIALLQSVTPDSRAPEVGKPASAPAPAATPRPGETEGLAAALLEAASRPAGADRTTLTRVLERFPRSTSGRLAKHLLAAHEDAEDRALWEKVLAGARERGALEQVVAPLVAAAWCARDAPAFEAALTAAAERKVTLSALSATDRRRFVDAVGGCAGLAVSGPILKAFFTLEGLDAHQQNELASQLRSLGVPVDVPSTCADTRLKSERVAQGPLARLALCSGRLARPAVSRDGRGKPIQQFRPLSSFLEVVDLFQAGEGTAGPPAKTLPR